MSNKSIKSQNQRGFTVLESLIIILVLVVIAGAGYFVYNNQKNNKTTTSSNTQSTPPPAAADPYAGWKSVTFSQTKLSFKYPAAWTAKNGDVPVEESGINQQYSFSADRQFVAQVWTEDTQKPSVDYETKVLYAKPVTFDGKSMFLDYYAAELPGKPPVNDKITGVNLSMSKTDAWDCPTGLLNGKSYNIVVSAATGTAPNNTTLDYVKSDSNYNDLAKFVESAKFEK